MLHRAILVQAESVEVSRDETHYLKVAHCFLRRFLEAPRESGFEHDTTRRLR